MKQGHPFDCTWVSYEVHPETPPEGAPLSKIVGPGVDEINEEVARHCAELGLPFAAPATISNSALAIEAAEFARDAGKHDEFHWALFVAFFAESRDIGDVEVLADVAAKLGLDGAALKQELAAGRYAGRRKAAREEARRLRVSRVPTYVLPEDNRLEGAPSLESLRQFLGI